VIGRASSTNGGKEEEGKNKKEHAWRTLAGKSEGTRQQGELRRRQKVNIRKDLREMELGGVD
jgi:hypothetical protein